MFRFVSAVFLILLSTKMAFAGYFNCVTKNNNSNFEIFGHTADPLTIVDVRINGKPQGTFIADDMLTSFQGQEFREFEINLEEVKSVLLSPYIDDFEDHERFLGFVILQSESTYHELDCKMQ